MSEAVLIENVHKSFRRRNGSEIAAVDGVSLAIEQGEFVVLLGPSGCGKTTLLRCIAGLESPTEGRITVKRGLVFDSASRTDVAVDDRHIGMVFQSYALWPHMTVAKNVGYPLRARGAGRAETRTRVCRILEAMRIAELADQYPGQISGGQQQRVALARAIVAGDDLILFDEPLSNIDARVRIDLRAEILALQKELGFTAVYVTHDQEEAMALASRIAVLDSGKIVQVGTPQDIYHHPASHHVARFVGSINDIAGTVTGRDGSGVVLDSAIGPIRVAASAPLLDLGREMVAMSRPERWRMTPTEPTESNRWKAVIEDVHFVGSRIEYVVDVAGTRLRVWTFSPEAVDAGSSVWLSIPAAGITLLEPLGQEHRAD